MKYVSAMGLPVYTLLKCGGMANSPSRLRKEGLLNVMGAAVLDEGDVELPHLERDILADGVRNLAHFKGATSAIHDAVRSISAERVLLIGGECSMAVGGLAGLDEVFGGKPGMLWMDAHGDFNTPETSPSSYIGGMCLAMACGRGPSLGGAIDGMRPILDESRLVHLGSRALDPPEAKTIEESPVKLLTSAEVRKRGAKAVGAEVAKYLSDRSDWVACHLDVDVADPDSLIAVNFPAPDGLRPADVSTLIKALNATGKLRALQIAAYNPSLDDDGSAAATVVNIVKEGFA
jgi:arginase